MTPTALIWLAFVAIACVMLFSLIRREQARLQELLEVNIAEQKEWVRKKAKAARMAHLAAKRKKAEEDAFLKSRDTVGHQSELVARQMDNDGILSS